MASAGADGSAMCKRIFSVRSLPMRAKHSCVLTHSSAQAAAPLSETSCAILSEWIPLTSSLSLPASIFSVSSLPISPRARDCLGALIIILSDDQVSEWGCKKAAHVPAAEYYYISLSRFIWPCSRSLSIDSARLRTADASKKYIYLGKGVCSFAYLPTTASCHFLK